MKDKIIEKIKVYFILFVVFSFVFQFGLHFYFTFDIFHHIKTGEIILQNKTIPHKDIFSFGETKYWVNHQWLTQIVFYLIYSKFNWTGLLIFKAFLTIITFAILFKMLMEICKNLFLSSAIIIISLLAMSYWIYLRAQIFTYLFLVILFYLIYQFHYKQKNYILFTFPFLMWLWINFHGGFLIGYIFLFIYIIGEIIKNLFPKLPYNLSFNPLSKKKISYLIIIIFISFLLGFLNPNHYHAYIFPFSAFVFKDIYQVTVEWSPPNLLLPVNHSYDFMLLLVILVTIFSLKKIELTMLIWILSCIYLSLSSWRHIPIFAFATSPFLANNIPEIFNSFKNKYKNSKAFLFFNKNFYKIIAPIVLCFLFLSIYNDVLIYKAFKSKKLWQAKLSYHLPLKAIEFLKNNYIPGRMFTNIAIGSYCIFELYPKHKVSIDSRFDTVYTYEYIKEHIKALEGEINSEKFLKKYNINFILVPRATLLVGKLGKNPNWKIIYLDDKDMIFIRNIPENKKFIEKYQKIEKIKDYFNQSQMFYKKGDYNQAINILRKILEIDPSNAEAYNNLGSIYAEQKELDLAISAWRRAIKINPNFLGVHLNLGYAYIMKGMKEEAVKEFNKVLEIDPNNEMAKGFLERLR